MLNSSECITRIMKYAHEIMPKNMHIVLAIFDSDTKDLSIGGSPSQDIICDIFKTCVNITSQRPPNEQIDVSIKDN